MLKTWMLCRFSMKFGCVGRFKDDKNIPLGLAPYLPPTLRVTEREIVWRGVYTRNQCGMCEAPFFPEGTPHRHCLTCKLWYCLTCAEETRTTTLHSLDFLKRTAGINRRILPQDEPMLGLAATPIERNRENLTGSTGPIICARTFLAKEVRTRGNMSVPRSNLTESDLAKGIRSLQDAKLPADLDCFACPKEGCGVRRSNGDLVRSVI